MSQLILSAHSGSHDAVAAVFVDYELRAAVQLERLTRRKSDGREHPDLAIDEVLSIAGATRADVDVVCFSRSEFPTIFYRNIRGVRWIREKYRKYVEGNTRRYMPPEFLRHHTAKIGDIFDVPKFRRAGGFRDDAKMFFYNHHESHALAPLFYTDWDDALLVTADGGGDTVNYSHRHFADGALTTIYGGEDCLLTPLPTDSLGHAYETVTGALGFIQQDKLRALAVTTAQRSASLPDVPTVAETVPGYEASVWYGIAAPKGVPGEIVDKLNRAVNIVLADPKLQARLAQLGGKPMPMTPAEFGQLVARETEKWAKVIKAAGIKAA